MPRNGARWVWEERNDELWWPAFEKTTLPSNERKTIMRALERDLGCLEGKCQLNIMGGPPSHWYRI